MGSMIKLIDIYLYYLIEHETKSCLIPKPQPCPLRVLRQINRLRALTTNTLLLGHFQQLVTISYSMPVTSIIDCGIYD